MTGREILYAFLLLAGFFSLLGLMAWDIGRACERAQREVDLDALWDEDDFEAAA